MAGGQKSALSNRRQRSVESFKIATECIGEIIPGMALFAITRGQFSMIGAILACLDQLGKASISLWTWTVAEYEICCMERLMADGRLPSGLLVIDHAMRQKNMGLLRQWQKSFGARSIRYARNHAKIATIQSNKYKLLLRGSMNLNFNPRFEQLDITEGGPDFAMVKQIEDELPWLPDNAPYEAVYQASKLSQAFTAEQLPMFGGIKRWQK